MNQGWLSFCLTVFPCPPRHGAAVYEFTGKCDFFRFCKELGMRAADTLRRQHLSGPSTSIMETQDEKTSYIRDVWQENLESEVANIREMVVNFPCISMVRFALSACKSLPPGRRTHGMLLSRNLLNFGRTLSSRALWQNRWAASKRTATTIIRRCVATSTC